jgi:cytochrome d ubiquinol oxidase subunit I
MDQVLLARIQFGMTIGFHFLFPPISIGLAWLLVWLEGRAAREEEAGTLSRLFGKIFAILYIVGIATGVVMSLQFGTNWGRFTNFVSGIFGPILVAEVLIAFFLESIFFGIWLFGRGRVSEGLRRASILIVAIGATISAFWITAADSWMQTPAGYVLSPDGSRALLSDFWAAVLNPSTLSRFLHVMMSAATISGFIVSAIAAYLVLKKKGGSFARSVLAVGVVLGLLGSAFAIGSGVHEAVRLGGQQPEKVSVFRGIGSDDVEPELGPAIGPGSDDVSTATIPAQGALYPPIKLTKASFWIMVSLGVAFAAYMLILVVALLAKALPKSKALLWSLVALWPLPVVATEFGWIAAEVGRQPWIVYGILKTQDAVSVSVSAGMLVFSLILISLVYLLFLGVSVGMVVHEIRKTPPALEAGAGAKGGVA